MILAHNTALDPNKVPQGVQLSLGAIRGMPSVLVWIPRGDRLVGHSAMGQRLAIPMALQSPDSRMIADHVFADPGDRRGTNVEALGFGSSVSWGIQRLRARTG